MGMFEYVDYRGPLPPSKKPRSRLRQAMASNLSQSKSVRLWETKKWGRRAYDEGCVKITVTPEGQLLDPDGQPLDWTGELRFYGGGTGCKWWEFVALFVDGRMSGITEAARQRTARQTPTTCSPFRRRTRLYRVIQGAQAVQSGGHVVAPFRARMAFR